MCGESVGVEDVLDADRYAVQTRPAVGNGPAAGERGDLVAQPPGPVGLGDEGVQVGVDGLDTGEEVFDELDVLTGTGELVDRAPTRRQGTRGRRTRGRGTCRGWGW
ncbi:hypothetical protein GCM10023317_10330 [Actinopolymorpha pittospori]